MDIWTHTHTLRSYEDVNSGLRTLESNSGDLIPLFTIYASMAIMGRPLNSSLISQDCLED